MRSLVVIASLILAAVLAAGSLTANPKIFKAHKNMKNKDGQAVNCVYCHGTAGIGKEKAKDLEAAKQNPCCAQSGCHPTPKEEAKKKEKKDG